MTDLNGKDHCNGTLTDYLWKLHAAWQRHPSSLLPLLDFCDHYQTCFLRRGLVIYCQLLLETIKPTNPENELF